MKKIVQLVMIFSLMLIVFFPKTARGQFLFFLDDNPYIGAQVPDIELPLVDGKNQKISQLIKEKNTILYFWARWCPPCRDHLKELRSMQTAFREKDINFILIGLGEDLESAKSYIEKFKLDFPSLADLDERTMEVYEIVGLPTFFFVNKDGFVTAVEHELPEDYEELLNLEI